MKTHFTSLFLFDLVHLIFAFFSAPVHPVAPVNVTSVVHAWNATVLWHWEHESYLSQALDCQVELTSMGTKTKVCCGYSSLLYICLGCESF